jgi:DHA1 family purine ribonucleoside efflux pump-like MFS transporter
MLLAWGLGGLVGNVVAGTLASRLRLATAAGPLLLAAALAVTAWAAGLPMLAAGVILWGLAFNMMPVATQLWVARTEREHTESAMGLQVTAYQVAIMVGAAIGGAFVDRQGVAATLLLGAVCAAISGAAFAVLRGPRS